MKCTINLPDTQTQQLEQYLKDNPNQTFDSLVQEALEEKLTSKKLSKLLNLAGIVSQSPTNPSNNPEDSTDIINPC